MSVSYEWHKPHAREDAVYISAGDLRELTEDTSDITDTTVGVSFDDGGGGAIVYGEPAVLLAYYAGIVNTLARHVAKMPPVTVADPAMIDSLDEAELYELREKIVATLDERSKDGVAEEVRRILADSGEIEADRLSTAIVQFPAEQYDDGWFYSAMASVLSRSDDPDPETVSMFHDTAVEDMLRNLSSARRYDRGMGEDAYLRVDLTDGTISHH